MSEGGLGAALRRVGGQADTGGRGGRRNRGSHPWALLQPAMPTPSQLVLPAHQLLTSAPPTPHPPPPAHPTPPRSVRYEGQTLFFKNGTKAVYVNVSTPQDCCQICGGFPECGGYTWEPLAGDSWNNTCELKVWAPGRLCFLLRPLRPAVVPHPGIASGASCSGAPPRCGVFACSSRAALFCHTVPAHRRQPAPALPPPPLGCSPLAGSACRGSPTRPTATSPARPAAAACPSRGWHTTPTATRPAQTWQTCPPAPFPRLWASAALASLPAGC